MPARLTYTCKSIADLNLNTQTKHEGIKFCSKAKLMNMHFLSFLLYAYVLRATNPISRDALFSSTHELFSTIVTGMYLWSCSSASTFPATHAAPWGYFVSQRKQKGKWEEILYLRLTGLRRKEESFDLRFRSLLFLLSVWQQKWYANVEKRMWVL